MICHCQAKARGSGNTSSRKALVQCHQHVPEHPGAEAGLPGTWAPHGPLEWGKQDGRIGIGMNFQCKNLGSLTLEFCRISEIATVVFLLHSKNEKTGRANCRCRGFKQTSLRWLMNRQICFMKM